MKVHVIHVPGIDPQRDAIVEKLGRQSDLCVHADPDRNGCMWNWLTAVDCARKDDQPWSIILSDDADPVPGWSIAFDLVQIYAPEPIVGLTYFKDFTAGAVRKGVPFIVGPHLTWGGAVSYRHDVLDGLAEFAHQVYDETGYQHDDRLISAYSNRIGHRSCVVTRALFTQPVEESLIGHPSVGRNPTITIASGGPASLIRWGQFPRYIEKTSVPARDQHDWLVKYGTPEAADLGYTFEKMRSGYVRKVPLG